MNKWNLVADMLQTAADTVARRGVLRDVDGYQDTVVQVANQTGQSVKSVLEVMISLKRVRLERSGDYDSAVDLLAYTARLLVDGIAVPEVVEHELTPAQEILIEKAENEEDFGLKAGEAV